MFSEPNLSRKNDLREYSLEPILRSGRDELPNTNRTADNRARARARPRARKETVMWSRFCGQVSRVAFVPKGLNDGSLAVYCLGYRKNRTVPLGNGMIVVGRRVLRP